MLKPLLYVNFMAVYQIAINLRTSINNIINCCKIITFNLFSSIIIRTKNGSIVVKLHHLFHSVVSLFTQKNISIVEEYCNIFFFR